MTEHNSIEEHQEHHVGYGIYFFVWLTLLGLTSLTVGIAGIDLGMFTLAVALLIAVVKSGFVINIFMHIKYDSKIFKGFLLVAIIIMIIIFSLTSIDLFYR